MLKYIQQFFFPENRNVCGVIWKKSNRVGQATYDNITRRMRLAC